MTCESLLATPYPSKLPLIEYEDGMTVRRVHHNGEIKWQGKHVYVSEVLAKELLGLKPLYEDMWELHSSFHVLGVFNLHTNTITPAQSWHGATPK